LNPLVKWIWLGGVFVVLGTVLALLPNSQPVLVMRASTQPAPSGAQPVLASMNRSERRE
jgi:hypothetical protein